MARGFTFDFYLSCDGENVLGSCYDGNECDLTSDDGGADNESVGDERQDTGVIVHAIIDAMIGTEDYLLESGWTYHSVRRGLRIHLCPACSSKWNGMRTEEQRLVIEATEGSPTTQATPCNQDMACIAALEERDEARKDLAAIIRVSTDRIAALEAERDESLHTLRAAAGFMNDCAHFLVAGKDPDQVAALLRDYAMRKDVDVLTAAEQRDAAREALAKAEERAANLADILADFLDDELCEHDHHGCQTHGSVAYECRMARARRALADPPDPSTEGDGCIVSKAIDAALAATDSSAREQAHACDGCESSGCGAMHAAARTAPQPQTDPSTSTPGET